MTAKRILLLDGTSLTAHRWSAGRIEVEGEFTAEPEALEELAAYLQKNRSSLFYLLADIAEEGFQLEDLPHVQGGDRTALLRRRLGQYYYNTPLSAAISLGRAAAGRRDEKLLFAALTRTETFTPWLDALRQGETRLAGVFSVPLVLAACAPQLLGTNDPVLFVSLTRGGVRQTFFDQGKLHFSRLSQLATRSLDEFGRTTATDSSKIFQYLVAQRQIPRGVPLHTLVLAHADEIPALQDFCRDTAELQFGFIELGATAQQLGLKEHPADSNADELFMHCLATKTPAQQFAPDDERRFYKLWQIRSALTSTAWVVLAACLLFAGKTGYDLHELRNATEATKAAAAGDARLYDAILARLPKTGVTAENLRVLIARFDDLRQREPAIEPLLVHLSHALDNEPKIELARISWNIAERIAAGPRITPGAGRAPGGAPPAYPTTGRNGVVMEIQAQLPPGLASDRRAQIEMIERFAARLRDPRTEVKVLSRPFDIESDKALKSAREAENVRLADAPRFSLRIIRAQ